MGVRMTTSPRLAVPAVPAVPAVLALMVALLLLAAPARAQDLIEGDLPVTGGPAAEGVYVQDSTAALDRFALAERLVALGEWAKAAEEYQETADALGRELVAARSAEDSGVYQYRPVAEAVRDRLAAWPAEGRDAYRERFGFAADDLLARALRLDPGGPERSAALNEVIDRYFLADAAPAAAVELIDRRVADGGFRAAARLAGAILAAHPDLGDRRPALLFRAAVAHHLAGDRDAAADRLDELRTGFPDATGTVAGGEANLAEVAAGILAEPAPSEAAPPPGRWPTLGGADDRTRVADATAGRLAPMFAVGHATAPTPAGPRNATARSYADARGVHQMAGVFPAVADDVAYWTDNARVYALGLDTRLPPPGWLATHPGDGTDAAPAGVFRVEGGAWPTPPGEALAPVVDGPRLMVNLARPAPRLAGEAGGASVAPPQLACLDRATGRPLWSSRPGSIPPEAAVAAFEAAGASGPAELAERLAECHYVGPPVVSEGRAWVIAKTDPQRAGQFEQAFLVGLDPRTGTAELAVYLATASQDRLRHQMRQFQADPDPVPAAADGRVYAPTGRGVLAAVSAADGRVEWVNLYGRLPAAERAGDGPGRGFRNRRRGTVARGRDGRTPSLPFHVQAPLVGGGRVFYRPPDADAVLVYDAAGGERLARLPADAPEAAAGQESVRTLLAVDGDRLFAFGGRTVFCLNWPRAAAAVDDGTYDRLGAAEWAFWTAVYTPADDAGPARGANVESIVGRPAVTRTHVLVPTAGELAAVRVDTGAWDDDRLGSGRTWRSLPAPAGTEGDPTADGADNAGGVAGNVVVAGDRVVVAGQTRLGVFADRDAVRRRLEARRAAEPDAYGPILRLAAVESVTGDPARAADLLAEAADKAGGREPAFESALALAEQQGPGRDGAGLLRLAERLAGRPAEHVRVRLAAGRVPDAVAGDAGRVAALQEILAEPAWRAVPVRDAGGGGRDGLDAGRTAGDVARDRIAAVVAEGGRSLYERVEARAAADLAEAGGDLGRLRRVADVYPNSDAAAEALRRLAGGALGRGEVAVARRALGELAAAATADGRAAEAADAGLRLAALDLDDPRRAGAAAARLRSLARDFGDRPAGGLPGVPPGVTVAEAAAALTAERLDAELARLPDANFPSDPAAEPLRPEPAGVVEDVAALLVTPPDATRADRLLVRRGDGRVDVLDAATGGVIRGFDAAGLGAEAGVWLGEEVVVWGEGGAARFGEDGGQGWRWTPADLGDAVPAGPAVAVRPAGAPVAVAADDDAPPPAALLEAVLADTRVSGTDDVEATATALVRTLRAAGRAGALDLADPGDPDRPLQFAAVGNRVRLVATPSRVILRDTARGFNHAFSRVAAQEREPDAGAASFDATAGVTLASPAADALVVVVGGRIAAIELGDGGVRWSVPLPAGEPVALDAEGDHAAVRVDADGRGPAVVTFDLASGRPGARRRFDAAGPGSLMNFALLPGGELAAVTPVSASVIDLSDPRQATEGRRFEVTPGLAGDESPAFVAAAVDARSLRETSPAARWLGEPAGGRVLAAGGDLVVYADPRRAGRRDAVVIDLATGRPLRARDAETDAAADVLLLGGETNPAEVDPARLPPRQRERAQAELRRRQDLVAGLANPAGLPAERAWSAGPRVYLTGQRGVAGHDLDAPGGSVGPHWSRDDDVWTRRHDPATVLDAAITAGSLLVFESPGVPAGGDDADAPPAAPTGAVRVTPFSRRAIDPPGYESGLEGRPAVLAAGRYGLTAMPADWRAVAGGLAVLGEDGRLVLLRGAGG